MILTYFLHRRTRRWGGMTRTAYPPSSFKDMAVSQAPNDDKLRGNENENDIPFRAFVAGASLLFRTMMMSQQDENQSRIAYLLCCHWGTQRGCNAHEETYLSPFCDGKLSIACKSVRGLKLEECWVPSPWPERSYTPSCHLFLWTVTLGGWELGHWTFILPGCSSTRSPWLSFEHISQREF